MAIHFNPNQSSSPLTATRLTQGIKGAEVMKDVAHHLSTEAVDTVSATDHRQNVQIEKDLQILRAAVESREKDAGIKGHQAMSRQSALMAAGALLGLNGVVVSDLAGQLHQRVSDKEALRSFADQVIQLPDSRDPQSPRSGISPSDTFHSLATKVNAEAHHPVAVFLGGAFLSAEQSNHTLLESARQNSPPPTIVMDDGYFLRA